MTILEHDLNDYVAEVLIRYFRKALSQRFSVPRIEAKRNVDILSQHWAFSPKVQALVEYLIQRPQELQAVLKTERSMQRDSVRGRIDAARSAVLQLKSGQPSWTVCINPSRTYESGPNHVIAWVLKNATSLLRSIHARLPDSSEQFPAISNLLLECDRVLKYETIRELLLESPSQRRPGLRSVAEALRSRRAVYRLAGEAYLFLLEIEAGDKDALRTLFNATVVGPTATWQKFELAVGLAVAEALSSIQAKPMILAMLSPHSDEPFASVGGTSIFWQSRTNLYVEPQAEPSEILANKLLASFGLRAGGDRPDFIVIDQEGKVSAVLEVKHFENLEEDGSGPLREALEQLVKYGRGYSPLNDIPALLPRCVVALTRAGVHSTQLPKKDERPWVVDFAAIKAGALVHWARAVSIESCGVVA